LLRACRADGILQGGNGHFLFSRKFSTARPVLHIFSDNGFVMSTAIMSSNDLLHRDLLHSVSNQLTVVMAQAELLARDVASEQDMERCREIKQAASKINRLLRTYVADSQIANP
jgi:two-component sensor histidine kinase